MKEISRFICEYCNTEYAKKEKADECEQNHKKPKKIIKAFYQPKGTNQAGYPYTVTVEMTDGAKVIYELTSRRA